VKNIATIRQK